MRLPEALVTAATLAGAVTAAPSTSTETKRASKFQFVGVNESGAEFGEKALPGQLDKDYTWPNQTTINTLIGQGMNTFRIPILMERFIPNTLSGSVNQTYAAGLDNIVSYITGKGAYAIIDPHNYGRYYGNIITDGDGFKSWWTTMAKRYVYNNNVIFDTNNEFHDEDNDLVAKLNQKAIDGIREAGAKSQYIFVEGNSWTGAWHWISSGTADGMLKLTDPADKLIYEMHQYLDSDGSGTSDLCASPTIGRERLKEATAWLQQNKKKAILGETAGGANTQCITALQDMLGFMSDNSDVWTGWLWWGAGPWWGNYIFGMEPPSGVAYTGVLPSISQYI
ncbi:glycoside hydrolase family 5 protein [Poronia punctata]|nr:glycoside hydrolase family 5 protein [Poronia punctata]